MEPLLWSLSRLRLKVEPTGPSCRYTPRERRWWGTLDTSKELRVPWGAAEGETCQGETPSPGYHQSTQPHTLSFSLTRPLGRPSRCCEAFTLSHVSFQRSAGRPSSVSSLCSS